MIAVELHGCDVDAPLRQHAGHFADMTGLIDILHDERRQVAGEIGAQTVHLHDHDASAAQRTANHGERFSAFADEVDSRRIGVFFRSTGERERKRHACVMRAVEAMRDALIIRLKAEPDRR